MDKKEIGISLSCFEDINLVNYYTVNAKKIIKEFTDREFIVYVHTNNPDEFTNLDCYIVPSNLKIISVQEVAKMSKDQKDLINFDEYWTFYRKIEDIDYVLDRHEYCLYLDSDNLPNDDTFNRIEKHILGSKWGDGIYFNGFWGDLSGNENPYIKNGYPYPTVGYLKSAFDYFEYINEISDINPSLHLKPFDESIMFIKKFDEWDSFKDLVLGKYQTAAINNDKNYTKNNDEPYRLFGRAEGLGWTMAIEELGLFNKAKSDHRIYSIRESFEVKTHPTVSKNHYINTIKGNHDDNTAI